MAADRFFPSRQISLMIKDNVTERLPSRWPKPKLAQTKQTFERVTRNRKGGCPSNTSYQKGPLTLHLRAIAQERTDPPDLKDAGRKMSRYLNRKEIKAKTGLKHAQTSEAHSLRGLRVDSMVNNDRGVIRNER